MNDLVISFGKQFIPEIGNILRGWLGSGNIRILCLAPVKFFVSQVDILLKGCFIDHKRHRQHKDSQLTRLCLGNSAIAVRNDCDFHVFLLPRVSDPVCTGYASKLLHSILSHFKRKGKCYFSGLENGLENKIGREINMC